MFVLVSISCGRVIYFSARRRNMTKNMGKTDKRVRIIVAVVIAILILTGVLKGVLAWILGIIAAFFVVTAAISFCPLYTLSGCSTIHKEKTEKK